MRDSSTHLPAGGAARCAAHCQWSFLLGAQAILRTVVCVMILLTSSGLANALEFREARWGFNGAVKRHSFNLCSIVLLNSAPDPFQGSIQLAKEGNVTSSEVPLIEVDVYIGPGEERTIQFLPFIGSDKPDWRVSWGRSGSERFDFPCPSLEIFSPVAVQLLAEQGLSSAIKGIDVFHEHDFPIGAPGADLLGSVVLDHIPRWDQVRSRAFRDWLGRGGRLYLINGRDGKPLEFPSPLEELNLPADHFLVGQGAVSRHAIVHDAGEIPGLLTQASQAPIDPNNSGNASSFNPSSDGVHQLFQTMRSMVRPDHNWALIFWLALIYLLILFPGIWLVSRKRGDYRVTYAMTLGTVVVFSWFYSEIGKRGYGESTGLREMMLAYPLGNQRIALQKHGSLFVTEGGGYAIPASGEGTVFTLETGTDFSGNAQILNRPQATLIADIPPYSACTFQESTIQPTQGDYSIEVKTLELNPGVKHVEVQLGAAIPANSQVYLVTTGRAFTLSQKGDVWVNTAVMPINSAFSTDYDYGYRRLDPAMYQKNLVAYLVQIATSVPLNPQYANAANYGEVPAPPGANSDTSQPFEGGQILVYCDAPAEFLPKEYSPSGKVLFVSRVDPSMATTPAP